MSLQSLDIRHHQYRKIGSGNHCTRGAAEYERAYCVVNKMRCNGRQNRACIFRDKAERNIHYQHIYGIYDSVRQHIKIKRNKEGGYHCGSDGYAVIFPVQPEKISAQQQLGGYDIE